MGRAKDEEESNNGTISRWRPDDYMVEMDRMFRDFQRQMQDAFSPLGDMIRSAPRGRLWFDTPGIRRPYTDLVDTGNEYKVVAEVPGIPRDKLNITVTPKGLTIKGEARSDIQEDEETEGGFVRRERSYTKIQRNLSFPEEVASDKAEAKLDNGLVEITVPKKAPEEGKARRLEIK